MRDNVCVFFTRRRRWGAVESHRAVSALASALQSASCKLRSVAELKAQLLTAGYTAGCKFRVVLQLLVTSAPRRASCGARRAQIPH